MSVEDAGVLPDPMFPDDRDERVSVRVNVDSLEELDDLIEEGRFRNRSHAIRFGLSKAIGACDNSPDSEQDSASDNEGDSVNDNANDTAGTEAH